MIEDSEVSHDVESAETIYTKRNLGYYDFWVHRFSDRFVWNCPAEHLLGLYNEKISSNHLDVGVGTGYFLKRCQFPTNRPRLVLMDLSKDSLELAAERMAHYKPVIYQHNILKPLEWSQMTFHSIGMNYLLHCLPGSIEKKSVVFDHLAKLLHDEGVLFGATILHSGVQHGLLARAMMSVYNKKRIFSNREDSLMALEKSLSRRFPAYGIQLLGSVALFWARK